MSERRRQRRRSRSRSRDRDERGASPSDERGPAEEPVESHSEIEAEPQATDDEEAQPDGAGPRTDGEPVVEAAETLIEDPEDPEAFGRWLRRQRELRGVELSAIAGSSKISLAYLRALESGRFGLLPAEIFAKGFVDQYARFIGLDSEEAVNFFLVAKNHRDEEEEALLDLADPPPEPSGARWVVVALILAALCLGVVWVLSNAGTDDGAEPRPVDSSSSDSSSSSDDAADGSFASESSGSGTGSGTGAGAGDSPSSDSSDIPAADTGASDSAAADVAARGPSADPGVDGVLDPSSAPLRVVVDFTDSCWVSAREDDGETLQKLFTQGESLILEAQRSVQLKLGNHRSAVVEVNGMPYDLAAAGRGSGLVRDVRIDLETVDRLRGEGV